jgi:hypothetical protein
MILILALHPVLVDQHIEIPTIETDIAADPDNTDLLLEDHLADGGLSAAEVFPGLLGRE